MDFNVYRYAKNLTPPNKRGKNLLAILYALVEVLAYLKYLFHTIFKIGYNDPDYTAGTYGLRDRVVYRLAVYESTIDGNTDAPNAETWRKLQDIHVGVDSRVKFTGGKLSLEYALNKIFKTTFLDPPTYGEIYITNEPDSVGSFTIGDIEDESSTVEYMDSSEFIYDTEISLDRNNFTIYFPLANFTDLGTSDEAREGAVRAVVDRYVYEGMKYTITTY
jgi:hypothetical protein